MLGAFLILYLIITLFIGIWISSRVKNAGDFISAGRKLPFVFNTFALFALWYGSETIFGASSEFAEKGIQGIIEDPFGAALCLIIYAVVFARILYRKNYFTLRDLFRDTYGPRTEIIASFFMIISFVGYIAAQLVALGILSHVVFNTSITTGILVSAAVVCFYTLTGGMWAVSVTDFIQSIVIMLGLLWVSFSLSEHGSLTLEIFRNAPEGYFRLFPKMNAKDILNFSAAWMVIGLGSLPSQDLFQRFNSAKSEKAAFYAGFLGAVLYFVFAALPLFIVLTIKVRFPETDFSNAQSAIPSIIMQHSSLPVQIMMLGALMSAIFSTCSGAILAPSTLLAENILKPVFKLNNNSGKFLALLRLSVIVMTASGVAMALVKGNIYRLVGESSVLGLVSMLVPMSHALFFKKHNPTGALLSMFLGFSAWVVTEYFYETPVPSLIIGLAASVFGLMAGNLIHRITGRKISLKISG